MGDDGFQVVKRKKPAVEKPPAPAEVLGCLLWLAGEWGVGHFSPRLFEHII